MHVGTTAMGVRDLMELNKSHDTMYKLNSNDCRHFVNKLTQTATGSIHCRHLLLSYCNALLILLHSLTLTTVQLPASYCSGSQ